MDIGESEPQQPAAPEINYLLGLDLGQAADFSALSALEKHGDHDEAIFHCRHLERFPLQTSYPDICKAVIARCLREPLLSNKPVLAIDATGCGKPVLDIFRRAKMNADVHGIIITGGNFSNFENGVYTVPKRELVSSVQACLQTKRLKIAADLPQASILQTELQNFQVTISDNGFDTYNGRVGIHDDLVLSLAMALWIGMRRMKFFIG
jgi:hypothetical protein